MMNCKEATALLSKQQEVPLSASDKLGLRFHLFLCRGCRNFSVQMNSLRMISRGYAKGRPPEGAADKKTGGNQ